MRMLVVISYYDRRPLGPLLKLMDSMDSHAAGVVYDRVLSVNSTSSFRLPENVESGFIGVIYRENRGMNIGAWNAAWSQWPGYDGYLFMQDECYVVREDWLHLIQMRLADPAIGLVGESINNAWNKGWDELRTGPGRDVLPEHYVEAKPANRVDAYLHHMGRYGIDPGSCGRHVRSLVWALRSEVMTAIGGFREGANYGECIAAEIGVSRAIEAMGLKLQEVGPSPFHAIRHREWNQDRAGGPFTHKAVLLREYQSLRKENEMLRRRVDRPTWNDLAKGVLTRLRGGGAQEHR